MFQKLRSNVRDANVKEMATAVGLMCFPAGLEGPEPVVNLLFRHKARALQLHKGLLRGMYLCIILGLCKRTRI